MNKKSTARDMTEGPIIKQMLLFTIPLLFGNIFQLLYNTVDTLVVGNFVGTQALAAVGSTTMIINIMVFFFNGLSTGASVLIGQSYGAKDLKKLHISVETTMAMTFLLGIIFTIVGVSFVKPMLNFMSTPADVMPEATTYLKIYFAGISGLMIYNMGSGILRAVGDTKRPLYFLIFTSVLNIVLDLFFVIVMHMGIAGVAIATIVSQFISAILVMRLLLTTNDIYKMTIKDLRLDKTMFGKILAVGLPAGIQSMLTSFSNVFVQSYVNSFGSACMAGWSCYNKLDAFIYLPMQSMSVAATTFVSQNVGANKPDRVRKGTFNAIALTELITGAIIVAIMIFAYPASRLFTQDEAVLKYAVLFIRNNTLFLLCNCVNQVLAGALRGRGDSKGPMIIMLSTFVVTRQIYLYIATHFFANTAAVVGFGYPVGWAACMILEVGYYIIRYARNTDA